MVAEATAELRRAAMLVDGAGFVEAALGTEVPLGAEVEKVAGKSETCGM